MCGPYSTLLNPKELSQGWVKKIVYIFPIVFFSNIFFKNLKQVYLSYILFNDASQLDLSGTGLKTATTPSLFHS